MGETMTLFGLCILVPTVFADAFALQGSSFLITESTRNGNVTTEFENAMIRGMGPLPESVTEDDVIFLTTRFPNVGVPETCKGMVHFKWTYETKDNKMFPIYEFEDTLSNNKLRHTLRISKKFHRDITAILFNVDCSATFSFEKRLPIVYKMESRTGGCVLNTIPKVQYRQLSQSKFEIECSEDQKQSAKVRWQYKSSPMANIEVTSTASETGNFSLLVLELYEPSASLELRCEIENYPCRNVAVFYSGSTFKLEPYFNLTYQSSSDAPDTSLSIAKIVIGVFFGSVIFVGIIAICLHFGSNKKARVQEEFLPLTLENGSLKTSWEVSMKNLTIDKTKLCGKGEYGEIYKATHCNNKKEFAVKVVKWNPEHVPSTHLPSVFREVDILASLGHHENIVQFVGACSQSASEGMLYLLFEFCHKGSLEKLLIKNRDSSGCLLTSLDSPYHSQLTVPNLENFSLQIANGMTYLEEKMIIHGDLAVRNILVTNHNQIKISDFGLSKQVQMNDPNYTRTSNLKVPWRYMAPESLGDQQFSTKTDVWAFGVTLWEIFSLAITPYEGDQLNMAFLTDLMSGRRLPKPDYASTEMYAVMKSCWQVEPSNRPTFFDLHSSLLDYCSKHYADSAPENDYLEPTSALKTSEYLKVLSSPQSSLRSIQS